MTPWEANYFKLGHSPDTTSEEYKLLKAFDRVFWLRYYGVMKSESLSPEEKAHLTEICKCNPTGCFFNGENTLGHY